MEFLQNNWFWIVLVVLFVWMHASGMGCGGHSHGGEKKKKREEGGGHQH
jgi:hypothetical protein